jgi:hypothetical protein
MTGRRRPNRFSQRQSGVDGKCPTPTNVDSSLGGVADGPELWQREVFALFEYHFHR